MHTGGSEPSLKNVRLKNELEQSRKAGVVNGVELVAEDWANDEGWEGHVSRLGAESMMQLCLESYQAAHPERAIKLRFGLTVPADYPMAPPTVQLLWPRVLSSSVHCLDAAGRFVGVPLLLRELWAPRYRLIDAVSAAAKVLSAEQAPSVLWEAPAATRNEAASLDHGVFLTARALPATTMAETLLDCSGKVVLPARVLETFLLKVQALDMELEAKPVVFRIASMSTPLAVHAVAESFVERERLPLNEGVYQSLGPNVYELPEVFLPNWMYEHLGMDAEAVVTIQSVDLPKASYVRFRPHDNSFFERHKNTRAVLLSALRRYPTLSQGTTVRLAFGDFQYLFDVLELRPGPAVDLQDTDFEVEFERWYVDPYYVSEPHAGAPMSGETTAVDLPAPLENKTTPASPLLGVRLGGSDRAALSSSPSSSAMFSSVASPSSSASASALPSMATSSSSSASVPPLLGFGGKSILAGGPSMEAGSTSLLSGSPLSSLSSVSTTASTSGVGPARILSSPWLKSGGGGSGEQSVGQSVGLGVEGSSKAVESAGLTQEPAARVGSVPSLVGSPGGGAAMESCGNCGKAFPASSMTMHRAYCERHVSRCAKCGAAVPKAELAAHEQAFHAPVTCPDCGQEGIEQDVLPFHLESECARRVVTCTYCEMAVPADQVMEHEESCGNCTELCPRCKQYIRLKLLAAHLESCNGTRSTQDPRRNPNDPEDLDHSYLGSIFRGFARSIGFF